MKNASAPRRLVVVLFPKALRPAALCFTMDLRESGPVRHFENHAREPLTSRGITRCEKSIHPTLPAY